MLTFLKVLHITLKCYHLWKREEDLWKHMQETGNSSGLLRKTGAQAARIGARDPL